jgi:diaminohydroxyphosphoribosylaminopyrimidine deaminase/5-amino-6-(5-phosphoribosylamino)uracil reductase
MLKLALGADNGIGHSGLRTNITSKETQALAHALRRVSDGILIGRNTVAIDNPQLTDRWPEVPESHRIFQRVVLDSRGSLNHACRVWQKETGHVTLRVLTQEASPIEGVEDLRLPPDSGGCSLRHLLHELTLRNVCRLLVEGGRQLAIELLKADFVDVLHIFHSNKSAGGDIVELDSEKFTVPSKSLGFNGGVWEIWERSVDMA